MQKTGRITVCERPEIDTALLAALVRDLGVSSAERHVGRSVDEISDWVAMAQASYLSDDAEGTVRAARHLMPVAQGVGLVRIARVAADVAETASHGDHAALAATLSRLVRLSDGAVHAIGDAWSATL